MKLTIEPSFIYGDRRCVRAVAVINKSKKKGIPRRYRKTWTMKTVAPEFDAENLKPTIYAAAKKWEAKIMAKIAADLLDEKPATLKDGELIEPTAEEMLR